MSEAGPPPGARAAEAAPVALILIDAEGRVTFLNGAAEDVLDRSRKRVTGAALAGCGVIGGLAWPMAARAISERRAVFAHDVPLDGEGGRRRAAIDAAPEGEGACICIRLGPEAGGATRGDQAAAAAAGFGRLLSHELKNPLAGARGAAQLIAQSEDEETESLARLIVTEIDRAKRIAERWSRIGDIAAEPFTAVNVNALARDGARSARVSAPEPALEEDYDPSLPDAWGDGDLLRQAVLNLLINAAEAAGPEGRVRIATRYRSARPGGPAPEARLEIEVSDDGPGVPDAIKESVFNPFVTGKPAGEGLGLALVSRIAELHHGGVDFDSRPGRTAFRLYLREAQPERTP